MNTLTKQKIDELLKNQIMVFIKGEPDGAMCGFSSRVIQTLKNHNSNFKHFNVLDDEEIWEGIKEHGNWPTIPQLYVNGNLVGGCDIVIELDNSGELQKILSEEL